MDRGKLDGLANSTWIRFKIRGGHGGLPIGKVDLRLVPDIDRACKA